MKVKLYFYLLSIVVLIIGGYLTYHYFMDGKEKKLNNKFYKPELDTIRNIRLNLKSKHFDKLKVKAAFVNCIMNRVFPYWYGTKWDFNGNTETPNVGSIACGYFVTTTLRDMGVSINRVKMAQCASEEMIKSLTSKEQIHHASGIPLEEFEKKLSYYGNGLYIIGLDNHTGFIYIDGKEHLFIHSTGWFPFKVVKDQVSESAVLSRSQYRVVGKISDDTSFLKRWINGK